MIKQSEGTCLFRISVVSGKISHPLEENAKWIEPIQYFHQSNEYAELSGIDGEPIQFEGDIFPGFTSIEIL